MTKLLGLLNRYKGYILHAVATGVLLVDPRHVDALIAAHPRYSSIGLLAWGWLLHWAQGRQVALPTA